jgi:hypothetical protein
MARWIVEQSPEFRITKLTAKLGSLETERIEEDVLAASFSTLSSSVLP